MTFLFSFLLLVCTQRNVGLHFSPANVTHQTHFALTVEAVVVVIQKLCARNQPVAVGVAVAHNVVRGNGKECNCTLKPRQKIGFAPIDLQKTHKKLFRKRPASGRAFPTHLLTIQSVITVLICQVVKAIHSHVSRVRSTSCLGGSVNRRIAFARFLPGRCTRNPSRVSKELSTPLKDF